MGSLSLRAVDSTVSLGLHLAHYIPGSDQALRFGGHVVSTTQSTGRFVLGGASHITRRLPGGALVLDTYEEILRTVGFLAAAAESPGLAAETEPPALLQASSERAEAFKMEAASRLASLLTRAERLAEREAAEVIER